MSREEAEKLLFDAMNHKDRLELETSLECYQSSLKIWMELYKLAVDGSREKKEYLDILENNMKEVSIIYSHICLL